MMKNDNASSYRVMVINAFLQSMTWPANNLDVNPFEFLRFGLIGFEYLWFRFG